MLVLKVIICTLIFILLFVARILFEKNYMATRKSSIMAILAGILVIAFGVILIINSESFIISKILMLFSICIYILFKEEYEICSVFWLALVMTVTVTIAIYLNNFKKCKSPDISIIDYPLICVKDDFSGTQNIAGFFISVCDFPSNAVYQYYYQIADGGIRHGTIPVDSTTIYFIEPNEVAHLEKTVATSYFMNTNTSPATRCLEKSKETYNLYIPNGSIKSLYEFDNE